MAKSKRKSQKKSSGFDEAFKDVIKTYFEKFAIVETEFEIHRLPRKIDILIIEADKPIKEQVVVFTYFTQFNVLDFKSEPDKFTQEDLHKMGYYIYGLLIREKKRINPENLTYTLVCSEKPEILFRNFKPKETNKKGLYTIEGISIIKVYVLVIDELERGLEKELKFLKVFCGKENQDVFINEILDEEHDEIILLWLFVLYKEKMMVIAKKKGIKTSGLEEKVEELAIYFKLNTKFTQTGRRIGTKRGEHKNALRNAIELKKAGMNIEFISGIVKLSHEWLEKFFKKIHL
ncbi:MAG: hypothetical protein KDK90_23860 [Leptospiraceae bacterium]|nr:hypothetical protein [Leptospiraceae bacterium]